jgi:hypothetical protein
MMKYLLNKLCNLFGYTIIPIQNAFVPHVHPTVCTKDEYVAYNGQLINRCDCEECLPW